MTWHGSSSSDSNNRESYSETLSLIAMCVAGFNVTTSSDGTMKINSLRRSACTNLLRRPDIAAAITAMKNNRTKSCRSSRQEYPTSVTFDSSCKTLVRKQRMAVISIRQFMMRDRVLLTIPRQSIFVSGFPNPNFHEKMHQAWIVRWLIDYWPWQTWHWLAVIVYGSVLRRSDSSFD